MKTRFLYVRGEFFVFISSFFALCKLLFDRVARSDGEIFGSLNEQKVTLGAVYMTLSRAADPLEPQGHDIS